MMFDLIRLRALLGVYYLMEGRNHS